MAEFEFDWDEVEDSLEGKRLAATDGRLQRRLEARRIPVGVRDDVLENYRGILRFPYLRADVESYSLSLRALDAAPGDEFSSRLAKKLRACQDGKRCRSLVCPVCRHDYRLSMWDEALSDFHEGDQGRCYAVTIIHGVGVPDGFGGELRALGDAMKEARVLFGLLKAASIRRRKDLRVIGAFEPDLHTHDELQLMEHKARTVGSMLERPSDVVVVLSSHLLVRCSSHSLLMEYVNRHLYHPYQARITPLSGRQSLRSHVKRIIQYPLKMGNFVDHKERTSESFSTIKSAIDDDHDIVHGHLSEKVTARANELATVRYYLRLYEHFGFNRLRVSVDGMKRKKTPVRGVKPEGPSLQQTSPLADEGSLQEKVRQDPQHEGYEVQDDQTVRPGKYTVTTDLDSVVAGGE